MYKILVVDDEKVFTETIKTYFEERKEFDILTENNPEKVIDRIKETGPDMIILDILMPIKNGLQILEEIKANEKMRTIPVIMLTAVDSNEVRHKVMQHDADAYMTKPVSLDDLTKKVEDIINA